MPTSPSKPQINWSQEHLEVTFYPGRKKSKQLTFTSSRNLTNIVIEPVPALTNFLTVQPGTIASVSANQPQSANLIFSAPADAKAGVYEGTVHIRDGRQTIPQTLKVRLLIKELPPAVDVGPIAPDHVKLTGVSEKGFNPRVSTIGLEFTDIVLSTDPATVHLFINRGQAAVSNLQLTEMSISFGMTLAEGRNELWLFAEDEWGRLVYKVMTLWAGSRTLTVMVSNEQNQPVNGATVTAQLGDDQSVTASGESLNGSVRFINIPDRTIILHARTIDKRFASRTTTGGAGTAQLKLIGFNAPSAINNNDFSQGTAGWNIGTAPVKIIPHVEGTTRLSQSASAVVVVEPLTEETRNDPEALEKEREARWLALQEEHQEVEDGGGVNALSPSAATGGNMDLQLRTKGEGPQRISRTFETKPGTLRVSVRYRFQTAEIPGGYFGSKYNDSFDIVIRSQQAGSVEVSQAMNGLGREAFDDGGWTDWYKTKLSVNAEGDVVQIDASVSNVGDGLFDSALYIDYVDSSGVEIGQLFAVPKCGAASVEVKMVADHPPVTLTLETINGGGEATFADDSTEMIITETTTVEIKGVEESSEANNIRLEAKDEDGMSLDTQDFSVVWVTLEARSSGLISNDNDARVYAADPHWFGTITLGFFFSPNLHTWMNLVETVGTVSPSDYKRPIALKKRYWSRFFKNTTPIDDATDCEKDSGQMSDYYAEPNGRVYALDAPGVLPGLGFKREDVFRARYLFQQWAELADDVWERPGRECERPEKIVSEPINWYSAISFNRPEGRLTPINDVPGDNQAGQGVIPLSWDLK